MLAAPGNRRQVLVVDDNPLVTHSLSSLLADDGFEVMSFTDASDALKYLTDHRPHIAIIDIHLSGSSGLDISHQIRVQYGPEIPIIIFSGDTSLETLRTLPEAGANYFLSKPIHSAQLRAFIKEYTMPSAT
jgi:two-component system, response regulator PdtaR